MRQRKAKPEEAQKHASCGIEEMEKTASNAALLDKIDNVTLEAGNDELVWACATRLQAGGCLRIKEGRPPVCPVYSKKKDPLFVCPIRVTKSFADSLLDQSTGEHTPAFAGKPRKVAQAYLKEMKKVEEIIKKRPVSAKKLPKGRTPADSLTNMEKEVRKSIGPVLQAQVSAPDTGLEEQPTPADENLEAVNVTQLVGWANEEVLEAQLEATDEATQR